MSGAEAPPASDLLLYQTEDGRTRVECRFEAETLWLTQIQMAELFQTTVQNISLHLQLIFQEQELIPEATIKSYLIVRSEGRRRVSRAVQHYSLPAILAVGFRVRGARGTQFRQWATARLEEYLVKGFTMDDARLRNPPGPSVPDYFDELLERIRDIRASERRIYLRVRETIALATDHIPDAEETQAVFQVVQNKLHFAVTGQTAPEPIAKNYLNAEEMPNSTASWSWSSTSPRVRPGGASRFFSMTGKPDWTIFCVSTNGPSCRTVVASTGATPIARQPMNTNVSPPAAVQRWRRKGSKLGSVHGGQYRTFMYER